MTRSLWKGPYIAPCFYRTSKKKISALLPTLVVPFYAKDAKAKKAALKSPIKVYSRNSIIIPQFVGKVFVIHNGHKFVKITILEEMVGHKFGEFSFTRKKTIHKKQKQKHRV